jgi:hypothetical protein
LQAFFEKNFIYFSTNLQKFSKKICAILYVYFLMVSAQNISLTTLTCLYIIIMKEILLKRYRLLKKHNFFRIHFDNYQKQILLIFVVIFFAGFLYYIIGRLTNLYLPCLFFKTTGMYCPGCGVTRMFNSLIDGDIFLALHQNAAVFFILIIWIIYAVLSFISKPRFLRSENTPFILLFISIGFMIIFGFIRNFIPALQPI